jgi:2-iminobutanoate/2-iminopropanoate deaminase
MTKIAISTGGAPAPIGPYSQGVRFGNLLFTAGQTGTDPVTQQTVTGGITEQTKRIFENLQAILEEGGSSLDHVIKATVFLKNMDDFAAMNVVYDAYLGVGRGGIDPPARTTVEVSRLPKNVLVEIEVIAEVAPAAEV